MPLADERLQERGYNQAHELSRRLCPRRNDPHLLLRCRATQRQAQQVANEVEALYTNGPAAGGGATKSVREVVAAAAVLVPREWAQPHVTVLG